MIDELKIREIIQAGESQIVEFKSSLNLRKEGCEALCAMINADDAQGMVLFGVKDDKTILGVEPGNLDQAQRSLTQHIDGKFFPKDVGLTINVIELNTKKLVILEGKRSLSTPFYEYDGRVWIRQGTEKNQLNSEQQYKLRITRNRSLHNGPWKCDSCPTYIAVLGSISVTSKGVKKSYNCPCGGEYW